MGLFGEVGDILATVKKRVRERKSYTEYDDAVDEEFGDALWYFAALCRRLTIRTDFIVSFLPTSSESNKPELSATLLELGSATAALFHIGFGDNPNRDLIREFWACYIAALQAANCDLITVAARNLCKARGRFVKPAFSALPTFDEAYPPDERLPNSFEITIRQRRSGQT